jgi:putative SOS response-associated peptidase YedK
MMCGRFAQYWAFKDWQEIWPADWHVTDFQPRYNVSPGTQMLSLVHDRDDRAVGGLILWGLKTPKAFLINARSETVHSRPTFRSLLLQNRLVIPLNGYYEWDQTTRQPYYIASVDGQPAWALGLYQPMAGGARAVILTEAADPQLESIHPRMPVLVDRPRAEAWLSRQTPQYQDVLASLNGTAALSLSATAVSKRVNSSREEDASLIQPLDPHSAR